MKPLFEHCIPNNFWEIGANDNVEELSVFKKSIENPRTSEEQYTHAFKGMIFMNEAVEAKHISEFNLTNVKVFKDSRIKQTVKVKYDVSLSFFSTLKRIFTKFKRYIQFLDGNYGEFW